mgnify:CR=1 FL=1|tara:strand:- start:30150 stop:30818 length:669 start_codon:yes stop_codon:yes gene_type:complete
MIVPNMQTRFTGYNARGTENLLNAVMQKRQQDITQDMANAANQLKREGFQLQRDLAKDANDLTSQGLAQAKEINDARIREMEQRAQARLADQAYRDRVFDLSNQIRQDEVKYKRGLAVEGINKAISKESEADRQREKTKYIENTMKNPFNRKSKAELGVEFDKIAPKQPYQPDMSRLIGSSSDVAPANMNQILQFVPQQQQLQTNFLNMLMLNQLGNIGGQY